MNRKHIYQYNEDGVVTSTVRIQSNKPIPVCENQLVLDDPVDFEYSLYDKKEKRLYEINADEFNRGRMSDKRVMKDGRGQKQRGMRKI